MENFRGHACIHGYKDCNRIAGLIELRRNILAVHAFLVDVAVLKLCRRFSLFLVNQIFSFNAQLFAGIGFMETQRNKENIIKNT